MSCSAGCVVHGSLQLSGWGCHKSPFVQQWSIPAEKLRADIVIPRPTLCMGMSLIILSEYHSAKGNWPISYSTLVLKARWTMIANYSFRTRELHGDKYLSPSPTVLTPVTPSSPSTCSFLFRTSHSIYNVNSELDCSFPRPFAFSSESCKCGTSAPGTFVPRSE